LICIKSIEQHMHTCGAARSWQLGHDTYYHFLGGDTCASCACHAVQPAVPPAVPPAVSLAWSRYSRAPMPARAPTHRAARRRTALGAARAELAALRRREADARGAAEARERRLADLAAGADELARKAAELRAELGAPLHAQLSDDERAELAALGPRLKQLQARPLSLRCAVCQLCCSGRPQRGGAGAAGRRAPCAGEPR